MAFVFMNDPATGQVALYSEPVPSGAHADPASARNAPLRQPAAYLAHVHFHSALDQMEVAAFRPSQTVTHARVAGRPSEDILASKSSSVTLGVERADKLIYAHGLGYVPYFLAAVNNAILTPGFPVQVAGPGRVRYVTLYATTTDIRVSETSIVGDTDMPAISVNYQILVFKQPPSPTGSVSFEFNPTTGVVTMGKGRFRSDRAYLQVLPPAVGSPFALPNGPTLDLKNGSVVLSKADGALVKPMPDLRYTMEASRPYGSVVQYDGGFTPPQTIPVQAP